MNKEYEIDGEIIIKMDIPFLNLIHLEIKQKENEHITLKMQVTVKEEDQEEVLYKNWSDTKILVIKKEEENQPVFRGLIQSLVCKKENRILVVEISGIGETIKLDRKKRKRSFQNRNMTYKQIIKEVLQKYNNARFVWQFGEDKIIDKPIIQYNETDWEFLKRLCSHFHGVLFADSKSDNINIFLGIGSGNNKKMEAADILRWGVDDSYYQNGCYENSIPKKDVFYLELETKENWQIGDFTLYENQCYQVYRRYITFERGKFIFNCRMGAAGICYQKKFYNKALPGVRLEGVIKKTEEESVYIQLDIDKQESADYPWIWAPETNNLCYCMPETGTKAVLYFPTKREEDGLVILSVVRNQKKDAYRNNENKEFSTINHKRLGLYPEKIFLESISGLLKFSMGDALGIQICSSTDVSFKADGKVCIEGKNVSVVAPIEVVGRTNKANVEICRDFNFFAPGGVRTIGTGDISEKEQDSSVIRKYDYKKIEHWQASYSAIAAVPAVDFGSMREPDDAVDIFACGSIPKVAKGSTTIALAEVMDGRKESETSFPEAFQSMENYTVKGGYLLPEKPILTTN